MTSQANACCSASAQLSYVSTLLRLLFLLTLFFLQQPITEQKLLAEPIGLKFEQSAHLLRSKHMLLRISRLFAQSVRVWCARLPHHCNNLQKHALLWVSTVQRVQEKLVGGRWRLNGLVLQTRHKAYLKPIDCAAWTYSVARVSTCLLAVHTCGVGFHFGLKSSEWDQEALDS